MIDSNKDRRVGKANGSRERAPDDKLRVPTIKTATGQMVGTALERLCPPYGYGALHLDHALAAVLAGKQSDQRLRRVLKAIDNIFLDFELAGGDP
jgi:hypothetical protein